MRLKHLTLHGFKTFAPKTDLSFGDGLTAIVGPNGSGKSNVADAVRWVLGEQSLLNLRAKKTEDLIFAGSSNRAPLGMAEVTLTLDNSDRLLPLEFSEVTLTRRAFRSGENEYYLNKSRVRLRDIQEIAAALGEAYTVVGQGLVDAALSLKPEERRELFEEAAEIRGYFVQREEALRRLSRTEENTTRLNDLLSELDPQVRRMERQARQAEEYTKLKAELRALLKDWYGRRWAVALCELSAAEEGEKLAELEVARLRAAVADATTGLAEARVRAVEGRRALSELQRRREEVTQRRTAAHGERAVLEERISSITERHTTLQKELHELELNVAALTAGQEALQAEQGGHSAEIETLRASQREVGVRLSALDKEWTQESEKLRALRNEQQRLDRLLLSLEGRIAVAEDKVAGSASAAASSEKAISDARMRATNETVRLTRLVEEHKRDSEASQSAAKEHKDVEQRLAGSRAAYASAEGAMRELTRRADAMHSQQARMDAERHASLYGGVRAVVAAASEGKVHGILGTFAELVKVPAHLEAAVEAALGGRLQEVVVEQWTNAERAIAFLKSQGAGRATFLPLDTLRIGTLPHAPTGDGIVGPAAQLVEHDPALAILAQAVLGRLIIVESLEAARRVVGTLPASSPWTLATLEGEVVRPGGSVTGGSSSRHGHQGSRTILSRERERRELLKTRDNLQAEIKSAKRLLGDRAAVVAAFEQELLEKSSTARAAREAEVSARAALLEGEADLGRAKKEVAWREELHVSAKADIASLNSELDRVVRERERTVAAADPLHQSIEQAEHALTHVSGKRDALHAATSESRTRLAVLAEAARNLDARRREGQSRLNTLQTRISEIRNRQLDAEREKSALAAKHSQVEIELAGLATDSKHLEDALKPSGEQGEVREHAVVDAENLLSRVGGELINAETEHSRAAVRHEHSTGTLDTLWVEMVEELKLDDGRWVTEPTRSTPEPYESGMPDWRGAPGGPQNALLMLGIEAHDAEGSPPPEAEAARDRSRIEIQGAGPMESREQRVQALRARLARMGPVNPLAGDEHRELLQRHDYLQGQLRDLLDAADHLRRIIHELDRVMSERFAETFAQVNEAFGHFFSTLFGGGSARLELTNPDDLSQTGIEISAQPPGKRMQPLAALSGGERALTSAALLFALLKVRPVPFCVLDEVDAALDESNVIRFRDALHELGVKTQFVVVTHNRGTIEAADVLYGVSMSGDGTSKLLSLKVG